MKITRSHASTAGKQHQRRVRGLGPVFTVRLHQRSLSYFIYFCVRHIPSHSQFSVSSRLVRFTSQPLAKILRALTRSVGAWCRVQFTTPQCIRFIILIMHLPYRHLHAKPLAGVVACPCDSLVEPNTNWSKLIFYIHFIGCVLSTE